jgi:cytochrome P450
MTASTEERVEARRYPFNPPDRLNLDQMYAQLRREEPLTRVQLPYGEQAWLATRYEDVRTLLGDPRFSRAASVGRDEPRTHPHQTESGMLAMDPPEHSRLRRLIAKAFTHRRVELLRPRVIEIAEEKLADMAAAGSPVDLVEHYATPLPVMVICELLGVPFADRDKFHLWSEAIVSTTSLTPQQIGEYLGNLHAYMAGLIAQRREQQDKPVDGAEDLLGALVRARDEDNDRLTEQELVQLAAGLLAAGHETTVTQIPNFVYVLLTNPERWAELRDHPELVPAAVEELMRYVPLGTAAAFARYATEDVALGGVLVRAGEPVLGSLASANRDELVFEHPDVLDFTRSTNPHIGFGHGPHHCVGAQLARLELQVAIATLVRRMPNLHLAVAESELPWKNGMLVRGLKELPVAW